MPCFDLQAALPSGVTKNGKTALRFIGKARNPNQRFQISRPECLLLPCRQCIGCRLERSRQWATRLMHETNNHPHSIFLTLTYAPNKVPKYGSLNPDHLKDFWKRLRKRNSYYGRQKIKYFASGEYGDQNGLPHYHAILYGDLGTSDPRATQEEPSRSGDLQYSHPDLHHSWPHGLHRFSTNNFETAAYVARYCLKKISGKNAQNHYGNRLPEFQRTSQGMGRSHFERWTSDIYPGDQVVLPGRGAFIPPPYYDRLLEKRDPALFQKVKEARKEAQKELNSDEWLLHLAERHREGEVRKLVTESTLIRGLT